FQASSTGMKTSETSLHPARFPVIEYLIARRDIARNDSRSSARQRRCDFKLQRLCSLYST
ncbi:MAG TPA: hypothetical protein VM821_00265, partial [Abditibacteriaceae bacterium]|nr:hypothetical protein [Abditibacteriaceae bacterium]